MARAGGLAAYSWQPGAKGATPVPVAFEVMAAGWRFVRLGLGGWPPRARFVGRRRGACALGDVEGGGDGAGTVGLDGDSDIVVKGDEEAKEPLDGASRILRLVELDCHARAWRGARVFATRTDLDNGLEGFVIHGRFSV